MNLLFDDLSQFSDKTFPESSLSDQLLKLKSEVDEVISEPSDISEYADVLICLLIAVYKSGCSYPTFLLACWTKFAVLKLRFWSKQSDGTFHHTT